MNPHIPDWKKSQEHIKKAEEIMDQAENMEQSEFRFFSFADMMKSAYNHIALARYYKNRNHA